MSESEGQRNDSPLLSERGVTTISDTVVSSIAGMAAQEVEGVHMGGGTSRTASGVFGSITGSESKSSGISVEVGRTETAIDLKMGVEYNKNILQTVEEVRRRITDRVQEMTGLRVKELNATITDITFPEKEARRRLGSGSSTSEERDDASEDSSTASVSTEPATQPEPESEPDAGESEITQAEPTSRAHTEGSSGPVPEEEVRVEDRPLKEGETAELRTEEQTEEAPAASEERQETGAEAETSEQEDAEVRRRRRAEERARRRRERSQDS
jgi:uncharacterized alkaline shock family protein YloU